MNALRRNGDQGGFVAMPRPLRFAVPRLEGDRYSRRVQLLKFLLPAIGLALLLLVAAWPRVRALLESVRLPSAAIDLRDARELQMVYPRYAGLDRHNRPYVVTAATGRQVPDRDDLMSLSEPRADLTLPHGATAILRARTGIYQSQAQLLDLFRDVTLVHQDGTTFQTESAHIDLAHDSAQGSDPVAGHGPSGEITAAGFRILARGDTIIFTGRSHLVLKGVRSAVHPATPPSLPAEIGKTATALEAAALTERQPTASPNAVPRAAGGHRQAAAKVRR
jgi:lipopolysaccharide export system protein LptC